MQSLSIVAGRLEKSALITDEMVRLFRETLRAPSRHARRSPCWRAFALQMGRFQEACDDIDGLVREADPRQLQRLQESQGLNYEVIARAWQSHALWCLGRPDTAFERASHALRLARQLGQPFSQAIAATYLALLQQLRADPATFRRQAEEALELATEFKATYYRAWAAILVAYAETLDGPDAGALVGLRSAIESFKETGARLRMPYYLALLADALPPGRRGGQPASTSWRRPFSHAGRRTSAGGTPSSTACAGAAAGRGGAAPRPRRKRPSGARSRSRADSRPIARAARRPLARDALGGQRPDAGSERAALTSSWVVRRGSRDSRSRGLARAARAPRLRALCRNVAVRAEHFLLLSATWPTRACRPLLAAAGEDGCRDPAWCSRLPSPRARPRRTTPTRRGPATRVVRARARDRPQGGDVQHPLRAGRSTAPLAAVPQGRPPARRGRDRAPGDGRAGHGAHRPRPRPELRLLPGGASIPTAASDFGNAVLVRWPIQADHKLLLPHLAAAAAHAARRGRGRRATAAACASASTACTSRARGACCRRQRARPGAGDHRGRARLSGIRWSWPATSTTATWWAARSRPRATAG